MFDNNIDRELFNRFKANQYLQRHDFSETDFSKMLDLTIKLVTQSIKAGHDVEEIPLSQKEIELGNRLVYHMKQEAKYYRNEYNK